MHLKTPSSIIFIFFMTNGLLACFFLVVGPYTTRRNVPSFPRKASRNFVSTKGLAAVPVVDPYFHNTSTAAPLSVQASRVGSNQSAVSDLHKLCSWKIHFWDYPYRLRRLEGSYDCPETKCTVHYVIKSSYTVMRTSDVVVLHELGHWDLRQVERVRRPDQILVYFTRESPFITQRISNLDLYNWTMTYSSMSEIPIPYGTLIENSPTERAKTKQLLRSKNWAHGKTGLAIWIVSNCGIAKSPGSSWHRFDYGKALGGFLNIDVFGRCGKPCGTAEECLGKISSYKFYIAFENSQCQEYITEKMWRNGFLHDAVPIVYGAPKSDYERLAPPNSFIHISDFANMSSLASYIDLLDKNDAMYNRYFEWKIDYHIEQLDIYQTFNKDRFCSISRKLTELRDSDGIDRPTKNSAKLFENSCVQTPRPGMV